MTQVQLADLAKHCEHSFGPVIVIYGGEPYQTRQALDLVRANGKSKGYTEIKRYEVNANFDWQHAEQLELNQGLFATQRIIELHLQATKLAKKAQAALTTWLDQANQDLVFVVVADSELKLDQAIWFKTVFRSALSIPAKKIPSQQLPLWISQQFRAQNLSITKDDCRRIAEQSHGNLLSIDQLITKLKLMYPDKTQLTYSEIEHCLVQSSDYGLFELTDALLNEDIQRTFRIFQSLKQQGVEEILVLWVITREMRLLIAIQQALQNGKNWSEIAKSHQLWPARANLLKKQLRLHSPEFFKISLRYCQKVDNVIKGLAKGNAWLKITDLLLAVLNVQPLPQEDPPICSI